MFDRKMASRTHGQLLRDELAESYGHLRLAAAHAAGGTAEKMTPGYDRARGMATRGLSGTRSAFSPLYDHARMGAAEARRRRHKMAQKEQMVQKKRSRLPALLGLLAAGAAVGVIGAVVARRRRLAASWEEYEPMPSAEESVTGEAGVERDMMTGRPSAGASNAPAGAADQLRASQSGGRADRDRPPSQT